MRRSLVPISALFLALTVMAVPVLPFAQAQAAGTCNLAQPAFCDTFDQPFPQANRTGTLDPGKWSISRFSGLTNAGSEQYAWFPAADAMHCKTPVTGVMPPNDYFECGPEVGESNHFMEAINAGGSYLYNDLRARQPFDFANRTGTVTWDVDAKNSGNHGWWTEFWITDQPIAGPHDNTFISPPRNGFGIEFAGNCSPIPGNGSSDGSATTGPSTLYLSHNYQLYSIPTWGPAAGASWSTDTQCVQAMPDMKNHIRLTLSDNGNTADLYMTDADMDSNHVPAPSDYKHMAHYTGLGLGFTRGYIHLEHATYNPDKSAPGGTSQSQTYHWDNIGFDGPVLPTPPQFSVNDYDQPYTYFGTPGVNTAYGVNVGGLWKHAPLVIPGVSLAGATSAVLTLSHNTYENGGMYQLNGGAWHTWTSPSANDNTVYVPVDLAELHSGDNTVNFGALSNPQQNVVSNVDLILNVDAPSTPGPTSTATLVPSPTMTASPSSTATSSPTLTPQPSSTATATPAIDTCQVLVLINGQQTTVQKPVSFCQPST